MYTLYLPSFKNWIILYSFVMLAYCIIYFIYAHIDFFSSLFAAISDYRQSLHFQNLNEEKKNIQLQVHLLSPTDLVFEIWHLYWVYIHMWNAWDFIFSIMIKHCFAFPFRWPGVEEYMIFPYSILLLVMLYPSILVTRYIKISYVLMPPMPWFILEIE